MCCEKINNEFEIIFREHYQRLYNYAFRMSGSVEDSEDLIQECFEKAYKAYPAFRKESAVYTWLYRILVNLAKKRHIHWKKMPVVAIADTEGIHQAEIFNTINKSGESEDIALTSMVRETCLQMFLNCMPPRYRSVFTLRIISGFSVEETSVILGIKPSSVKVYLHRARKIAQNHMTGKCSLIKDQSLCNCRSFASYLQENGLCDKVIWIKDIVTVEEKSAETFSREVSEIRKIESLYRSDFSIKMSDAMLTSFRRDILQKNLTLIPEESFS
ncbi:MAG: RNA polymerase sigma factor [Spirochaetales bacterium]|nr:RNA polymerase sigma factor [Spirochaetales bacterium]